MDTGQRSPGKGPSAPPRPPLPPTEGYLEGHRPPSCQNSCIWLFAEQSQWPPDVTNYLTASCCEPPAAGPHSLSFWALDFHDGWQKEDPQQQSEQVPASAWATGEAIAEGAEEAASASEGRHRQLHASDGHRSRS